ncbi:hypothetical protein PSMK_13550 [Phycisphaera mikurensis NBRC 102666]|uniref:Uncharacterized protein n=1 Tax=Phycisphaera mikurensis (strain NBRC 102666 / KCTC 22515 / FYK2301M01) TaxID=1142394 RepID=I0IE26_PHYMF|nr:hypothetical protein PSMK_13550 [Phycisphaera mikurensis NBRC 102666]
MPHARVVAHCAPAPGPLASRAGPSVAHDALASAAWTARRQRER